MSNSMDKNREGMEIYIHIPFCIRKCHYCDFLSFPIEKEAASFIVGNDRTRSYLDALKKEMVETARFYPLGNYPVDTVFIGGGTPSVLPETWMGEILEVLRTHYSLSGKCEITIEANPGTLTKDKLMAYRRMGINRLSIGLQSPDDRLLKKLGRIHTYDQFMDNYKKARDAGFDNINIDLMSGLPGQTVDGYEQGLHQVLDLRPDHISSYSLILEEGTPFYENVRIREELPDEKTDRLMYRRTKEILKSYGYERYEISNYALKGKECRHNLGYWSGIPYLGFGLGAASCYFREGRPYPDRFSNTRDLIQYVDKPFIPFEDREDYESLTKESFMEEYMFLGLRKTGGVSLSRFEEIFGISMTDIYGPVIQKYEKMGLLLLEDDNLRLTEEGIDVSDYIFTDFVL